MPAMRWSEDVHGRVAIVVIAACLLGWALVQRRLASTAVTGPMVFVAIGLLIGADGFRVIDADWMCPSWSRISVVAVALMTFASADLLGGSGFTFSRRPSRSGRS